MKIAHTSSKHIGIVWRTLAAVAAIVIVLLATSGKCPASATTATAAATSAPSPTTAPAVFRPPDLTKMNGHDTTWLLWQMLAATVVILVLGALAFVVVKRLLPKIGKVTGKRISVLETVYLQPKKALHLIEVGSRKFLLASSPEGLSSVGDVTDAFGSDYAETARRIENEAKEKERTGGEKQNTAE